MKQNEKLDLILRYLYDRQNDGHYWEIEDIFGSYEMDLEDVEMRRLMNRLETDKLVELQFRGDDGFGPMTITTHGIDYCENNSYSSPGSGVVITTNNITINNSPGANIVNYSENVTITNTVQYIDDANKYLSKLEEALASVQDAKKEEILEIQECIAEIRRDLQTNNIPKYSFRALLALLADIASLAPYTIPPLMKFVHLIN